MENVESSDDIDVEQAIVNLYEELIKYGPCPYRVCLPPAIARSLGWKNRQLVTKYNLPLKVTSKVPSDTVIINRASK